MARGIDTVLAATLPEVAAPSSPTGVEPEVKPEAQPDVKHCPRCGTSYHPAATFCQRDGAALEAPQHDPLLGRVLLGQYRLDEVLGVGGMGRVYRARQLGPGGDVAVKVLHGELLCDADAVRRFQREARLAAALDHPNLVRVLLQGELEDGRLYLVLEYLPGRTLAGIMSQGPLSTARALELIAQVCEGAGEAHAHGIVHRDIKPDNVHVVDRSGRELVKVLDFGVARVLGPAQTILTQSGLIFGTARYISPEGASGDVTDPRSDVYSIGVLLYEMLAGVPPFDGASPVTVLMKHVQEPPPDLGQRAPHVAEPIGRVVMQCLHKDPSLRPADARALGGALARASEAASRTLVGPAPVPVPGPLAASAPAASRAVQEGRPSPAREPHRDASSRPGSSVTEATYLPSRAPFAWASALVAVVVLVAAGAWLAGRTLRTSDAAPVTPQPVRPTRVDLPIPVMDAPRSEPAPPIDVELGGEVEIAPSVRSRATRRPRTRPGEPSPSPPEAEGEAASQGADPAAFPAPAPPPPWTGSASP